MNKAIFALSLVIFSSAVIADTDHEWPAGSTGYSSQMYVKETAKYKGVLENRTITSNEKLTV